MYHEFLFDLLNTAFCFVPCRISLLSARKDEKTTPFAWQDKKGKTSPLEKAHGLACFCVATFSLFVPPHEKKGWHGFAFCTENTVINTTWHKSGTVWYLNVMYNVLVHVHCSSLKCLVTLCRLVHVKKIMKTHFPQPDRTCITCTFIAQSGLYCFKPIKTCFPYRIV